MQNKKFEELLKELNQIVEALEKGDLSLEESVEKYQQGLELWDTLYIPYQAPSNKSFEDLKKYCEERFRPVL